MALAAVATDLFDDTSLKRESAQLLLARLRARLGDEAIRALSPLADHRPERAWRLVPPGSNQPPVALADAPVRCGCWPNLNSLPTRATAPDRRPRAHRKRLVGRSRRAARLLRGGDPEGGRWWIFRELEAPRGWYLHGFFA